MLLIWDGKQLEFWRLLPFREFMPRWWTFLDQLIYGSGLVRLGATFFTLPSPSMLGTFSSNFACPYPTALQMHCRIINYKR
jgi:hypothetical protein